MKKGENGNKMNQRNERKREGEREEKSAHCLICHCFLKTTATMEH